MKKPNSLGLAAIGLLSLMLTVSSAWAAEREAPPLQHPVQPRDRGHRLRRSGAGGACLLREWQGLLRPCPAEDPERAGDRDPGAQGYMANQGLTIAPKDRVTVTGSLISILGKPFILAMEVEGDRTMKLREASGRPAWAVGDDWHIH